MTAAPVALSRVHATPLCKALQIPRHSRTPVLRLVLGPVVRALVVGVVAAVVKRVALLNDGQGGEVLGLSFSDDLG